MGKYEKRRHFRQYRKAGVPFVLSAILSRKPDMVHTLDVEGYTKEVKVCGCGACGPTHVVFTRKSDGASWYFRYGTGSVD